MRRDVSSADCGCRTPVIMTRQIKMSALVIAIEARAVTSAAFLATVGVGTPGSISPRTGLMRNANSRYMNGRRFREDLETAIVQPVRMANDANCLALSEAIDGIAADAKSAFAVIVGTGCCGGHVINGRMGEAVHGIAGQWAMYRYRGPKRQSSRAPALLRPARLSRKLGVGHRLSARSRERHVPDARRCYDHRRCSRGRRRRDGDVRSLHQPLGPSTRADSEPSRFALLRAGPWYVECHGNLRLASRGCPQPHLLGRLGREDCPGGVRRQQRRPRRGSGPP